jgi:hypothetical protein
MYGYHPEVVGRAKRRVRNAKRARRAKRVPPRVVAKPGCRPLSRFHPAHPIQLYGPGDERYLKRDTRRWE